MDIRNIKQAAPKVSCFLSSIYELGKEQLDGYRQIETLPDYPLDINNPKNQVVLKDFISRVIEELTEGYESTHEMVKILDKCGWNTLRLDNVSDVEELKNHMQNANEEQADALGFFVTLLLYSNILPEDIFLWVDDEDFKVKDLRDAMAYGIKMAIDKNPEVEISFNFPLLDKSDFGTEEKYKAFLEYAPGFNELTNNKHYMEKSVIFDIIYQLNVARNLLKCRPWKQTQVMTKELEYQSALVNAFYLFLGFLGLYGFTPESLHTLFFKKQQLNLWRQNSGY